MILQMSVWPRRPLCMQLFSSRYVQNYLVTALRGRRLCKMFDVSTFYKVIKTIWKSNLTWTRDCKFQWISYKIYSKKIESQNKLNLRSYWTYICIRKFHNAVAKFGSKTKTIIISKLEKPPPDCILKIIAVQQLLLFFMFLSLRIY